jgi:hypothetical protein
VRARSWVATRAEHAGWAAGPRERTGLAREGGEGENVFFLFPFFLYSFSFSN